MFSPPQHGGLDRRPGTESAGVCGVWMPMRCRSSVAAAVRHDVARSDGLRRTEAAALPWYRAEHIDRSAQRSGHRVTNCDTCNVPRDSVVHALRGSNKRYG